jgi:hypothetical protein
LAKRGKEGEEGEGVFHGYLIGHTPAPKVANLKGAKLPKERRLHIRISASLTRLPP